MKLNDNVVTSKGRFGSIKEINDDNTKALVLIGKKQHEILLSELTLLSNSVPINVHYIDKYDVSQTEKTEVLHISRNTILYSLKHEEQIEFLNTVKLLLLKRLNNLDLLIVKIKLL